MSTNPFYGPSYKVSPLFIPVRELEIRSPRRQELEHKINKLLLEAESPRPLLAALWQQGDNKELENCLLEMLKAEHQKTHRPLALKIRRNLDFTTALTHYFNYRKEDFEDALNSPEEKAGKVFWVTVPAPPEFWEP